MNPSQGARAAAFRERVVKRDTVCGTFIKTSTSHSIEIIGGAGYDFVLIDAEHAPFDRVATDTCILAARAVGTAPLVRVASPNDILGALDDGAYGVMVPHLTSASYTREIVGLCRYGGASGKRGFSNSPRAGDYGVRTTWEHLDAADKEVLLLGMIEDPEAIGKADEILAVEGLDAVFIGRGDLTAAYRDREAGTPQVAAATLKVIEAARRHNKPVFMLTANAKEAAEYAALGVSGFVTGSDQGFMRSAATSVLREYQSALAKK
ncbi:MAG: aldolase/citrate lyase family protein [Polaromonas sp.]|nr:aldolase/citrate lyase family protein [Polaromonas sp.]